MTTTQQTSKKVAFAVGTVLVMSILVLIALASGSFIVSTLYAPISFLRCILLIVLVIYDIVIFLGWHTIVAKLNKFFWSLK